MVSDTYEQPHSRKVQFDLVQLDSQTCHKLMRKKLAIFTGIFSKPQGKVPLYFLPEVEGLGDLTEADYEQLMQYILNRIIMSFQNRIVTKTSDKLTLLIDRKSYGWSEVFKILKGIDRYCVYIHKIILIGPSKFYGFFSFTSLPENFAHKISQYATIEQAVKEEPYLDYSQVPDLCGGSLVHNWIEYFELEKEAINIYLKLKNTKALLTQLKVDASLILAQPQPKITVLQDLMKRIDNFIMKLKMDITDPIDMFHTQSSMMSSSSSPVSTLVTNQIMQFMWLGGKAQYVRLKLMPIKIEIERRCEDISQSGAKYDQLNQLILAVNARNDTVNNMESNFTIDKSIEYMQFLLLLRSDTLKFKKEFDDIIANQRFSSFTESSSKVKEVEMDLQNFKTNVNNFETNICSCLLLLSFESNPSDEKLAKLAKDIDSFLSSGPGAVQQLSERLQSILRAIRNKYEGEAEQFDVPIVS